MCVHWWLICQICLHLLQPRNQWINMSLYLESILWIGSSFIVTVAIASVCSLEEWICISSLRNCPCQAFLIGLGQRPLGPQSDKGSHWIKASTRASASSKLLNNQYVPMATATLASALTGRSRQSLPSLVHLSQDVRWRWRHDSGPF